MNASKADLELIHECIEGSSKAWETFVTRYSKLVYHSINRALKSYASNLQEEDIEDIYHNVFLSFIENNCRKLRQFEGKCTLSSWIRLIAVRQTIDYLRTQKQHVSLNDVTDDARPMIETIEDRSPTAHEYIELSQAERIMKEAIESLSPSDRLFMELYYEKEYPPEEIAGIMNVTISTIYSKKNRIREKLESFIGGRK